MQDDLTMVNTHDLGEPSVSVAWGPAGGEFAVTDPVVDLDGDGVLDTRSWSDADGVTVASDLDGDGWADHVTRVDGDGEFGSWEPHREVDGSVRWERVDAGQL
ncbi:DUF6802 family protein [Rhodococcus olei]